MTVKHKLDDAQLIRSYKEELRADLEARGIKPTLEYIKDYGDLFILEDEDVTQSIAHLAAIRYFTPLLYWLYHGQNIGIAEDFMFYLPGIESSKVGPDIAVVEGLVIDTGNPNKSYGVGVDGPAPRVVFEFASESTWDKDLTSKWNKYALLGVQEYFVCDPNPEQVWQEEWLNFGRLAGWTLNPKTGLYIELAKDEQGRIRSNELQSLVLVESEYDGNSQKHWLRLYDWEGQTRLTETQYQSRRAEEQTRRADQAETDLAAQYRRVQELEDLLKKLKPE